MEGLKILVIKYPNPERVGIQTNVRLSNNKYTFSEDDGPQPEGYEEFKKFINSIPGIKKADVGRHVVDLERFVNFDWDDLIKQVIVAIVDYLALEVEIKIDDRRAPKDRHHHYDDFLSQILFRHPFLNIHMQFLSEPSNEI